MHRLNGERMAVLFILLLYAVLGTLFALHTPDWQAPDEPAHFNYIAQVAEGNPLPVIAEGDWDQEYLEALKAARFAPELLDDIESIRYENHQPPLYYWLGAPIYALSDGSLIALRLYSLLLGGLTLLAAYMTTRLMLGIWPALGTLVLMAFLPQHLAILASVNNDALAWLLVALGLWWSVRHLKEGAPVWQAGLVLGLIFITKSTAYFMAAVFPLAVWLRARREGYSPLRGWLVGGIIAAPLALFWWGRNIITYGWPDFLGLRAHDAVVVGQLRTDILIEQIGWGAYLQQGVATAFNSFWGQFGWMGVPLMGIPNPGDDWIYPTLLIFSLFALAGLLWRRRIESQAWQREAWRVMLLALFLALGALVYYNTEFVQFQGRYLFTALLPFALLITAGLDGWRVRLKLPGWILPLPGILLALLDAYLIWRVIPGALSP